MALRLRRGTNAQRLLITPLEGELIYTTDTQEIYVGDGVTAGGVRVTGNVPANIEDLENVSSAVPGNNDVLIWDALTSQWTPIPLDTIAPGSTLASMADVTFTGLADNQILSYDTATSSWINTSSLTGSVLANDASLVVDATTGNISPAAISARNNLLDLLPSQPGRNEFRVISDDSRSVLKMQKRSASDLTSDTTGWGSIFFARDDDINGPKTTAVVQGGSDYIYLAANTDGDFTALRDFMVWRDGRLGLGTITPASTLDIQGSAIIRTELRVLGSADIQNTLTANAIKGTLVADDSSIVVDGITGSISPADILARGNLLTLLPTTTGRNEFRVISDDSRSVLKMQRSSSSDLRNNSTGWGSIFFERDDEINGSRTTAVVQGGSDYIYLAANIDGDFTSLADFMIWRNGSLGLGTTTPTATLDVQGNAVFTGDVEASAFKGSYVLDDSTIIIDGVTGNIFLPSIYASDNVLELLPTTTGRNEFKVVSQDSRSILKMTRLSESDLSTEDAGWGSIFFERDDEINGSKTTAIIQGGDDYIYLASNATGTFSNLADFMIWRDRKLGIGMTNPATTFDMTGDNLRIVTANVPATSLGSAGDLAGMIAVDDNFMYRCIADYDGVTDIWRRLAWIGGAW